MEKELTFKKVMEAKGMTLNMLLSFVVMLLLVTAAPVAQFKGKGIPPDGTGSLGEHGASTISCVTVWGVKLDCMQPEYSARTADMDCATPKKLMQVSEAFYIISVFTAVCIFIVNTMALFDYAPKIAVTALCGANTAFSLIPWVCVVAFYKGNYCGGSKVEFDSYHGWPQGVPYGDQLQNSYDLSAGFILTVIAFVTQLGALVALIVM